jgi:hypothetical protein
MKSVDYMVLKFNRDKEPPDYQARYRGPGLTFAQLKVWTLKAESFDDVVKSAKLRKLFDL